MASRIKKLPARECSPRDMLVGGSADLCGRKSGGKDTAELVLVPQGWSHAIHVGFGVEFPGTPGPAEWERILEYPAESGFTFLGVDFTARLSYERYPSGELGVEASLLFAGAKEPFARLVMDAWPSKALGGLPGMDGLPGGKCIGLVLGGSPMTLGRRNFFDVARLPENPGSRAYVAGELWGNLYDALVNCDEEWVEVTAYSADTTHCVRFRIDDDNEHEEELEAVKAMLADGKVDVVNIRPKGCIETNYVVVPVEGK